MKQQQTNKNPQPSQTKETENDLGFWVTGSLGIHFLVADCILSYQKSFGMKIR